MAYLLFFEIVLILIFTYSFVDHDFLSPVNIYLLFSVVSIFSMFLFYSEWNVEEYGIYTVFVYLLGSVFFVLGCGIAKLMSSRNVSQRSVERVNLETSERIEISYFKIVIVIGISLLAVYGTYSFLKKLVGGVSISTIGMAINRYRYLNGQGQLVGDDSKSSLWRLFSYMSAAFSYCCIFIVIKNAVNRQFKKKDLLLVIPFVLRILENLLQASRGGVIYMIFAAVMSWFISMKYKGGWRKKINSKVMKILIRVGIVFIPLFFLSLIFMGRYDTLKGFDFKNVSLIYLSGGVRNLDQFLKAPTVAPSVFGEETFVTLHKNLYISSGIGHNVVRFLEFRTINGKNIGNIYTSYRRFYHDFGLIGIFIFPLLEGIIISSLYYGINRSYNNNKINFREVLYCYLSYTTMYMVIDDTFYSTWISISGLKQLIILFFAYFFMFNISSQKAGIIRFHLGKFRISSRSI